MPSFLSKMLGSGSSGSQKRKVSREESQAQAAEAFLAQGQQQQQQSGQQQQQSQSTSSSSGPSRPVPIPRGSDNSANSGQQRPGGAGGAASSASGGQAASVGSSAGLSESADTSDVDVAKSAAQFGSSPHRAPHKHSALAGSSNRSGATEPGSLDTDDASINEDDDNIADISELANALPKNPAIKNGHALPTTQAILANPTTPASSHQRNSVPSDANNANSRAFDLDNMIARLLAVGYSGKASKSPPLKTQEMTAICQAAREVFMAQPAFLELSAPVKIVGDIHGQYWDLIRLFQMTGYPPEANFLFLGDYVDRGKQSLETILLLLCYKIKYPSNFFMLRGNHESASVTRVYGFYDECKRRCSIKIWKQFVDVFNCLPIAATIAGKIFCVHGGLSPSLSDLDNIRKIQRPTDVPDFGLLNDLLWSDPSDSAVDWEDNERGVSYCFGKSILHNFLQKYDLDLLCRAHMVVEDGYEFWNNRQLLTIFSAPNYCGEFDNFGAVMAVNDDLLCSFELLKPLDGAALKKELVKYRQRNAASAA